MAGIGKRRARVAALDTLVRFMITELRDREQLCGLVERAASDAALTYRLEDVGVVEDEIWDAIRRQVIRMQVERNRLRAAEEV